MSQQTEQNKKNEDNLTPESKKAGRRDFLKFGFLAAGLTVVGGGIQKVLSNKKKRYY